MRALLVSLLLATPAAAWEFTATPVCTLNHEGREASVSVTYDPRLPEPYAIAVTTPQAWPAAPVFGIAFSGNRPQTITTTRHRTTENGRTLTVSDRGFGNVLDGIEFGTSATAFAGATAATVSLSGAAPEVQKFRACVAGGLV